MHEIVIHSEADEELKAAALFYESRRPGLGQVFLHELSRNFKNLSENPFLNSKVFDDYRRCLMRRFPYGVVYRIEGETVFVLAIAHLRRKPEYWRART